MKTNNPLVGYGFIIIAIAWAIAAVIIGFKYQQKSFLLTSFLAVLALLSVLTGVLIIGRLTILKPVAANPGRAADIKLAQQIHLSALSGFIIPLGNILLPFLLWKIYRHRSTYLDQSGLQAVNFQLTCGAYLLSALLLCAVFIGFVILPVVLAYQVLFTLVAAYCSRHGNLYHYPGNLNFIASMPVDVS